MKKSVWTANVSSPAKFLLLAGLIFFLWGLQKHLGAIETAPASPPAGLALASSEVGPAGNSAQEPTGIASGSQKVRLGLFMLTGGKVDFVTSSLSLDFYLWLSFTGSETPQFEFLNSKNFVKTKLEEKTMSEGPTVRNYVIYRVNGTFDQNFDLKNYPFDHFTIKVFLEDTEKEAHERVFEPDVPNSGMDPMFHIMGWNIESMKLSAHRHQYNTTFGEPEKTEKEVYSQVELDIQITRNHEIIFVKTVIPAVLFLLIGVMGVLFPIEQLSQKISLCVASLFSSVAYHLSLSQGLPPISYLTFVDKMMLCNYCTIFINLIFTISIFLTQRHEYQRAQYILTRAAWIVMPTMACGIVYWLVIHGFYS